MIEKKYQGNYITVTKEVIDGHIFECMSLRAGVQVIPLRGQKILLINESRVHEHGCRCNIVSSWCDKQGRTTLDHATEKLAEEAGLAAADWEEIYNNNHPGAILNARTTFFVCRNVSELSLKLVKPDHGCEVLEQKWFTLDDVFQGIHGGLIWPDNAINYLHRLGLNLPLSKQKNL